MTKMSTIEEILREKCFKNCRQVKICMQKWDLLGLTPIWSPKITWDDQMGLFSCHNLKAECLRSILSFYRTQNTSKTPKLWQFENLHKMVAAPIWYFLGEIMLRGAVSGSQIWMIFIPECVHLCPVMILIL